MQIVPNRISANLKTWETPRSKAQSPDRDGGTTSLPTADTFVGSSSHTELGLLPATMSAPSGNLQLKNDPDVRAALQKVPGMKALNHGLLFGAPRPARTSDSSTAPSLMTPLHRPKEWTQS